MKTRKYISTAREVGFTDAINCLSDLKGQLNNSINPTEDHQTEAVPERESVIPIMDKVSEVQYELIRMGQDYSLWRNRAKKGLPK